MLYALNWFVIFSLLALWSLAAWAFHAVTAWTLSSAGAMAGTSGAIEALRVPDWLAHGTPPELALAFASMLSAFAPAIEAALRWAPALEGGLSAAVWAVWGIGSVLLIVLGFLATGMIAMLRRRVSAPSTPSGSQAAAR